MSPDESLFVFDAIPPRQYVGVLRAGRGVELRLRVGLGPVELSSPPPRRWRGCRFKNGLNATQLCKAKFGTLYLHEEGKVRLVAAHDMPAQFAEVQKRDATVPVPGGPLEGAIRTKGAVQITDLAATEAYRQRQPRMVDTVELGGIRTAVAVPMLKDSELIGAIAIHLPDVALFNEKQIALLTNFAAQAVIAIENARLLNELRQRTTDLTEALEQQTATSEVLQIIRGSIGDVGPVFATMLENAVRICDATFGNIYRWDGEALHLLATSRRPPSLRPEAV